MGCPMRSTNVRMAIQKLPSSQLSPTQVPAQDRTMENEASLTLVPPGIELWKIKRHRNKKNSGRYAATCCLVQLLRQTIKPSTLISRFSHKLSHGNIFTRWSRNVDRVKGAKAFASTIEADLQGVSFWERVRFVRPRARRRRHRKISPRTPCIDCVLHGPLPHAVQRAHALERDGGAPYCADWES